MAKATKRTGARGLLTLFAGRPSRLLQAGEALFRQNTPVTDIFFLVRGRVRLIRHTVAGHAITLHVGVAGELFAEGALFSDVYQCDALTDQASEVKSIGSAELIRHLEDTPALALAFLERVTQQLHRARALVELRNIRSAEERVLQHLRLSLTPGADAVKFQRPLMQVATDLGLTHEAYYRCLSKLTRDGIIEREGRSIRLLN